MQQENKLPTDTKPTEEEQFEMRPWVKYAAIGLGLSVLLAVEFATYRVGYGRGYGDAIGSGEVKEKVNAIAVENLHHFMQVSSMSDTQLNEMVADYQKKLAWIREPAVRDEAEWLLVSTMAERGRVKAALPLAKQLFKRVGMTEAWARRAALVARHAAAAGLRDEALAYYRGAAARFKTAGVVASRVAMYAEMVELLASAAGEKEAVMLSQLQQEMEDLGVPGQEVRSHVLAYLGNICRSKGQNEQAFQYFEQALQGVDISKSPSVASAAVCYGIALLEKGEVELAERFLRDGVSRLGESPNDAAFLVVALRDLARLEQSRGKQDKALALLYRAEGAADGRINEKSPFWLCLFDQRGWVHFSRGDYESALADFSQAVAQQSRDELLVQPLEGAGRSCIALGKADEALAHLNRCVQLRREKMSHDITALGRVNLLLGQACDMAGDAAAAVAAYAQAVEQLPEPTPENDDKMYAMMGRAYALSQLKQWTDAAAVWSRIIELSTNDKSRLHEAKDQLERCRRHGAHSPADEEKEDEDSSEPVSEH
ncbi:MAG: hypothetical protein IJ985_08860 [Akkermansia sp.]|nr:hypothetical protein [Akkermansia sp.]